LKIFQVLVFSLLCISAASPQKPDSVTIPAGAEYNSGSIHRMLYGDLWRDLWTTPAKIPVLDLNQFDGGLTPFKKEDSTGTLSLFLQGSGGKIWKFRSLNKFTTVTLHPDLRNTFAGKFFQEMTAAAPPAVTLILSPMMDSLGILHSTPLLCFIPDDVRLGDFRDGFRNLPGTLEIDSKSIDTTIISTENLIQRLLTAQNEKVDGNAFLKERLFDVFVNDWNRGPDQWEWMKPGEPGNPLWKPLPKNRDKAFSRFDGLYPKAASFVIPEWTSFDGSFPPPDRATRTGGFLDKMFLSEISRQDWDSVADFVVAKLTNELFDTALSRFPKELLPGSASYLKNILVERRGNLKEFSAGYYNYINKVVDIFSTDFNDKVEIIRTDTSTVIAFLNQESGQEGKTTVHYKKKFDSRITEDIRIHLVGGDDKVKITGYAESGPLIRIDGGKGKDSFIDSSEVGGWFLNFLPFRRAENKNIFFDDDPATVVIDGPGTVFRVQKPFSENEVKDFFDPVVPQHGRGMSFNPVFDLSSTLGLQFGGGPVFTNYDFRKKPWDSKISFVVSYATKPKDYDAEFEGWFNSIIEGTTIGFKAFRKSIDFNRYYGYGNETAYDPEFSSKGGYNISRVHYAAEVSLDYDLFSGLHNFYQVRLSRNDTEVNFPGVLVNLPAGQYGLGVLTTITFGTGLLIDKRDHPDLPLEGYYFKASGYYTPKFFYKRGEIYSGNFDVRGYIPVPFLKNSALALRVTGERVLGDFPFFMSAFLGGSKNLRGFRNERFSGDASLYGCAELRISLGRLKTLVTSNIGLYLFTEAGRVFRNGESSTLWHVSNGVGIWSHIFDRALVIASSIAFSQETVNLSLSTKVNF